MKSIGTENTWLPTFFKISARMFHRRKKVKQVWNAMKVTEQFHFHLNCPFKTSACVYECARASYDTRTTQHASVSYVLFC